MKKNLIVITLITLIMSSCASGRMGNPNAIAAGAAVGGTLGNAVGGIIGENNRGWRGGYRGSAIGTIVGTIAGAAIGNALTAPRQERVDEGFQPITSRGDSYSSSRSANNSPSGAQAPVSQLRLQKIRFIDDNRNHTIDAGEKSKIIFEIMNEGKTPIYNVVPIVEQVSKMKHILISPSVMIEEILPGEGIRYTATVAAGERLKDGQITFRVAVSDGKNGEVVDYQDFTLPTEGIKR